MLIASEAGGRCHCIDVAPSLLASAVTAGPGIDVFVVVVVVGTNDFGIVGYSGNAGLEFAVIGSVVGSVS